MTSLSIIMPAYNEERTLAQAVDEVLAVDYPCAVELIVIDDGSTDRTSGILDRYESTGLTVVRQSRNMGKGAAVRAGVERARGTHLIIFDADLEYRPADIPTLLAPVIAGVADHVFGTRVFGLNTRFQSFKFAVGGRATTLAANIIFDSCLTDMHTCLKLIPRQEFLSLDLRERGFGLDTQLTAQLLSRGVRPYEVPVTYRGRSVADGKKINWRDGVRCLLLLLHIRLTYRPALGSGLLGVPVAVADERLLEDSMTTAARVVAGDAGRAGFHIPA
jgi:glycosyltransferase involved in cell wall biosynthesis